MIFFFIEFISYNGYEIFVVENIYTFKVYLACLFCYKIPLMAQWNLMAWNKNKIEREKERKRKMSELVQVFPFFVVVVVVTDSLEFIMTHTEVMEKYSNF